MAKTPERITFHVPVNILSGRGELPITPPKGSKVSVGQLLIFPADSAEAVVSRHCAHCLSWWWYIRRMKPIGYKSL